MQTSMDGNKHSLALTLYQCGSSIIRQQSNYLCRAWNKTQLLAIFLIGHPLITNGQPISNLMPYGTLSKPWVMAGIKSYRSIIVENSFGIPWILGGRAPMKTWCIHVCNNISFNKSLFIIQCLCICRAWNNDQKVLGHMSAENKFVLTFSKKWSDI